ncbi:glycosyltransferase family 1 protein [Diaminobutyricimonas sp. TR449]|uniref:glycosyltransferase family 4 protein n=1 Tax=Diaminobutyricimonas sp. TR449 TaxID=2708076 RepID=UPI0014233461|nr:glycosyltransferase family 1 protein [Diaminobutyricimonas sp. TR449]
MRELVAATDSVDTGSMGERELVRRLAGFLSTTTHDRYWFALAVLEARFPLAEEVVEAVRVSKLDGSLAGVAGALTHRPLLRFAPVLTKRNVRVVKDSVVVDVDHTSTVEFATGIQRVVRETVKRWVRDHPLTLVGWTPERTALRPLSEQEVDTALTGAKRKRVAPRGRLSRLRSPEVVDVAVPLGGTYVLAELSLDRNILLRLAAMAEYSSTKTAVIGYDAVPLSSAETANHMVSGGFANNLAAVKHMDKVATISEAAAIEYRGWRDMLVSTGITGPEITAVSLSRDAGTVTDTALARAREVLLKGDESPLVLVVGSHEPRKNHDAVLQAAEILWRDGLEFQLLFVGGNAWNSGLFTHRITELRRKGRLVRNITAVDDELLWSAYRLASFTVFPSLNEGYGLPIVESLSVGTPVITSDFGSMKEITVSGGALHVDPYSDADITAAMRSLLEDEALRARLGAEGLAAPKRSWDDYARETWEFLVGS